MASSVVSAKIEGLKRAAIRTVADVYKNKTLNHHTLSVSVESEEAVSPVWMVSMTS